MEEIKERVAALAEGYKHLATKADLWKTAFAIIVSQTGLILGIFKLWPPQ